MNPSTVSIDEAVEYLNNLLANDTRAISALVAHHEPCNEWLANHPNVPVADDGIGLLGILNGMFAGAAFPAIVAEVDNTTGTVLAFKRYAPTPRIVAN